MTKKDHRYVPIFTHSIKEQKDIIRMIQYIVIVTNLILIAPESNYFLALFLHNVHTINSLFIEEFFTSLKLRKKYKPIYLCAVDFHFKYAYTFSFGNQLEFCANTSVGIWTILP